MQCFKLFINRVSLFLFLFRNFFRSIFVLIINFKYLPRFFFIPINLRKSKSRFNYVSIRNPRIYIKIQKNNSKSQYEFDIYKGLPASKMWPKTKLMLKTKKYIIIGTEYLKGYKRLDDARIDFESLIPLCLQISEELEKFGIIHCDVSTSNLLYNDKLKVLKLCDFETAFFVNGNCLPSGFNYSANCYELIDTCYYADDNYCFYKILFSKGVNREKLKDFERKFGKKVILGFVEEDVFKYAEDSSFLKRRL